VAPFVLVEGMFAGLSKTFQCREMASEACLQRFQCFLNRSLGLGKGALVRCSLSRNVRSNQHAQDQETAHGDGSEFHGTNSKSSRSIHPCWPSRVSTPSQ